MIGIILTIVLLVVVPMGFKFLGVENYQMFNAQSIFTKAGQLLNSVFSVGQEAKVFYNEGGFDIAPIDNGWANTSRVIDTTTKSSQVEYRL